MNNRLLHPPTIELPSNQFETPLRMDVQAFLDFSFWMSEKLLDLETKHAQHSNLSQHSHLVKH